MSLVPSLLQAIVRVDGEALVMHAGDKPYVVSPTGQVDLASRGLTLEAVNGIVAQLLPTELQNALDEFGAVQHELAPMAEFLGEHFTVVAARGGDDVWAEIRRRRIPEDDRVPEEFFAPPPAGSSPLPAMPVAVRAEAIASADVVVHDDLEMNALEGDSIASRHAPAVDAVSHGYLQEQSEPDDDLLPPAAGQLWPEDEVVIDLDAEIDLDDVDGPEPEPITLQPAAHASAPLVTLPESIPDAAAAAPMAASEIEIPEAEQPTPFAHQDLQPIAVSIDTPEETPDVRQVQPAPIAETLAMLEDEAWIEPIAASIEAVAETPDLEAAQLEPAAATVAEAEDARPIQPTHDEPIAATVETAEAAQAVEPVQVEPIAASVETAPNLPRVSHPLFAAELPEPTPEWRGQPEAISAAAMPLERLSVPATLEMPLAQADVALMASAIEAAAAAEPTLQADMAAPPQPAIVLNMSRNPIRSEVPPPAVEDPTLSGLERLLRLSSARGASTLYLSSESRPSVRVDGELQMLEGEPVHVARDVESLLLTLMPERNHEALRTGAATEWICDLEGVGRVRCMSFRDQRGPGGVFRLMPTRSVSADQLGLPRQVQALAIEPEGLVLVAGPRSSGKRTTISAFVDLMNRTRRDHIITIEREINIQHARGQSFISQREVRGSDEAVLAEARAAMREDPDVLVIEELRTGALVNVALEAAAAGRLVVGGFNAHTATGAIDRIIDLYPPEQHRQVQMALADSMRGVIAQVLLRKVGGGRLPAREVLLNTPAVSSAIAEGKTSQLPMAIEGGRRYGMMPLNDALAGLVQSGSVEPREAYRHSPDRPGFLAALNRQGLDTTFVERLANG